MSGQEGQGCVRKICSTPYVLGMNITTQIIDYGLIAIILLLGDALFLNIHFGFLHYFGLVWLLATVLMIRDDLMGVAFKDSIAEAKVTDSTPRTLMFYLSYPCKVNASVLLSLYLSSDHMLNFMSWHCSVFDLSIWTLYFDYLGMLCLKDLMFFVWHPIAHSNWMGSYMLHKQHHTGKDNLRLWNAMNFDWIDLILEDAGAPFWWFGLKTLFGFGGTQLHTASYVLCLWADVMVHSLNPYSVCYCHPVLDFFFFGNVAHALHHSLQRGWYSIIPWHHLIPGQKRADIDRYNEHLGTDFRFLAG